MSDDFIPIMCGIIDSSITAQPAHVFKAWILMLAAGGIEGKVVGAPGNLARRFGLTREEMAEAIHVLSSPDPDSTTPDEEGRRIIPYDDSGRPAWAIVNRRKYHDIVVDKLRKERDRRRKAEERAVPDLSDPVRSCPDVSESVQGSPRVSTMSPSTYSSSSPDLKKKKPRPHSMPDDWAPSPDTLARIGADKIPEGFTKEVREWFTSKHLDEPKITKPDWDGSFSRTVKRHWASEWGDRWRSGQRKTPKDTLSMGFID